MQDLLADLPLVAQLDDCLALGGQRLAAQAAERGAFALGQAALGIFARLLGQPLQPLLVGEADALEQLRVDDRRLIDLGRGA